MARLRSHKHLVLLGGLVAVLVMQPLVGRDALAARFAFDLLTAAAAVGVMLIVFVHRWERRVAIVLALPAIALTVARYTIPEGSLAPLRLAYALSAALFLGFAVAVIVRDIFKRRVIGFDDVVGAFAGYILLGVAWGSLYAGVEAAAPSSFTVNPAIQWQLEEWHYRRALFNYLSFTVLASMGYNDITPIAPFANTLTWMEVMSAQFYLAVVVAQIVGLKLARAASSGQRDVD